MGRLVLFKASFKTASNKKTILAIGQGGFQTYLNTGGTDGETAESAVFRSAYHTTSENSSSLTLFLSQGSTAPSEFWVDDGSVKQLTDGPVTGCRLLTGKGGSTEGLSWRDTDFNPNSIESFEIY